MTGLTQSDKYDILDEDLLTEAEHDALGDSAPHHPKSHAIISPDHTDIDDAPATGSHPEWDGTKYIHVTGSSETHDLDSSTHPDVHTFNKETGDLLMFSAGSGKWHNVPRDTVNRGAILDNDEVFVIDNDGSYVTDTDPE